MMQCTFKSQLRFLTCGHVDAGKSTLTGRLLYDSQVIYEDQLATAFKDSKQLDNELNLALLVDGLQAEREQGITIDVAYRYFNTDQRKFIITDTPGHEQYTRNMITGASNCELAIILIDAQYGVQTQTKRHSFIASLLGIKHFIIAINKMDLVDFDQAVFEQIKMDYLAFAKQLNLITDNLCFVPLSALKGDNVIKYSERMPWYCGQPILTILEELEVEDTNPLTELRFPVQYVNRSNQNLRGFAGSVVSGVVCQGDSIKVLPSGQISKVGAITTFDGELKQAVAGQAITLTLTDEIDVYRGDLLVHVDSTPLITDRFEAMLVWMAEQPMQLGKKYDIKRATNYSSCTITSIEYTVDVNSLAQNSAIVLHLNEIAKVKIALDTAMAIDNYQQNYNMGAFIVIDCLTNNTVGAGMIISSNAQTNSIPVSGEERVERLGQKPVTILFTGLSGAGKTTLAYAVERKLFDLGRIAHILDSQNLAKEYPQNRVEHSKVWLDTAHIAKEFNKAGLITLAAFVAPDNRVREQVKELLGAEQHITVYTQASPQICQERDPHGLYAANQENIPGESFPYDIPLDADIVIDTQNETVDAGAEQVIKFLREREFI